MRGWPWKEEATPVSLRLPPGYTFTFTVKTNIKHSLWPDEFQCEIKYVLYLNEEVAEAGSTRYSMKEDRLEQKIFLFARKRAGRHNKNLNAAIVFPYQENKQYELSTRMTIDGDLLKSFYDYED